MLTIDIFILFWEVMGSKLMWDNITKNNYLLIKIVQCKKRKKKHMQSLLGVFCISHMPNLGVVNIKKWRLNNVSESNPNWKGITITFLPM
jgi:hypothetical protein